MGHQTNLTKAMGTQGLGKAMGHQANLAKAISSQGVGKAMGSCQTNLAHSLAMGSHTSQ